MLKYFLFMGKLSRRAQWGIILGAYFGFRALSVIGKSNPNLRPWILPLIILYVVFALMTWIADPFFNLMLRLSRFGRLALTREKVVASNWLGLCMLLALCSLGGCIIYGFNSVFLIAAIVFGALLLPVAGTFKCAEGSSRNIMAIFTGIVACAGIVTIVLFALPQEQSNSSPNDPAQVLLTLVILGALASSWIMNILIMQKRRR
jgi:hypothetical protein